MDRTFCLIKQLPILKPMDDKEVVQKHVEVILDQETRAETPEHLDQKTHAETPEHLSLNSTDFTLDL